MVHALMLILALGQAPKGDDQAVKDRDALQGRWEVVHSEADGKETPEEDRARLRLVVDGNLIRLRHTEDREDEAAFTLDATASPKRIDARITDGPDAGKLVKGIYKVEGEKVTFCWSDPGRERPDDFTTGEDSHRRLFVMKKAGK